MAQSTLTIDRLFDRSSRLPYPLRARTSPVRRWTMLFLFITLSTIIGVYWYMTDTRRVRAMAETYLTQLSGAQVTVGKATLSIFEGLRLDDVRVYSEPPGSMDPKSIRSLPIFSASRFQISYNLNRMLQGKLEATRIVATNPRMLLAEDLDTHTWNYQKLTRPQPSTDIQISSPSEPLKLPELQLRDARLEYIEVRSGVKTAVGSMALEGHLIASADGNAYRFELQSRGISQGMGPSVSGAIDIHTGQVNAKLKNFTFGRDIKAMLPALARTWLEQHQLAGRIDVPELHYTPQRGDRPASFRVETQLDSVALSINPAEWMSRDEISHLAQLREGLQRMDAWHRQINLGLPTRTPYESFAELLETEPVKMQRVSGAFLFTEKGIEIRRAEAQIEGNSFDLSGKIDGYDPDVPMRFRLASRSGENLVIPALPRYINAIPGVRELFLHLRPQGECQVEVNLVREEPGDRAVASGFVRLVDAQFQYVRFPYPMQRTSGRIEFGPDPKTGVDRLEIHELRGHGVKGGPNEKSVLTLKGTVAPLGPDTGIQIVIQSDKIFYEPLLHRALPFETQEILKHFESPTHPNSPLKFEGGFVTRVNREPGFDRDVYVETDVRLDDAAGTPAAFPYPLHNVRGLLRIKDDHLEIVDVKGRNGDASVKIEGRVTWTPFHEREGVEVQVVPPKDIIADIKLTAVNVPIDDTLINALPPEKRPMLQKLGVTGRADVTGMLTQRPPPKNAPATTKPVEPEMRYDLAMKITNGGVKPKDTEWSVGDLTADVQVSPERLVFKQVTATRAITPTTRPVAAATQPAVAMLVASGAMELTEKEPKFSATVSASNLQLDQAFYGILPKGTQEVWDEVKPNGTVDLTFTLAEGKDKPFTMTLRPRELAVQPAKLPLPMDRMSGEVRVVDELVTYSNLQARSGDAAFYLDGTQRMDQHDWNVKFSARELNVTKEFLDAVPGSVKAAFASIGLRGKIALDFEKLRVVMPPTAAPTTNPATTAPAPSPDIDFVANLWLDNASFDAGVPVEKAKGRFKLAATFRQDRLEQVEGLIDAYSLSMAGRQVTNFRAKLMKRPDQAGLRLDDIQADVAQGTMAGRMDLIAGDPGPSRYVMNFSLRNADIAALTQEADPDQKIKGTLSASLSLEGAWGDAASRRGRGDVVVQGKQIVKLPLLLGLFQITNLALPITGPLSDATARYNIDGPVTTFERIELKGANLLMTGDGRLDFDKGTVRLRFNADNPGGIKIPVISELLESGTRELLTIHVKGSIEKPKVQAGTFDTISTTVDEVLGGDEKKN